jgi:hypothetical protein
MRSSSKSVTPSGPARYAFTVERIRWIIFQQRMLNERLAMEVNGLWWALAILKSLAKAQITWRRTCEQGYVVILSHDQCGK